MPFDKKGPQDKKASAAQQTEIAPVKQGKGHKQRGAGTVITAKPAVVTDDGIVLKAHERLPSQLLQEYCQKEKRPNPKYFHEPPGTRYKVILEDPKNSKNNLSFCPNHPATSDKVARDFAALLALHHFQKTLPLERKLPEPYSTTWIQMISGKSSESLKETSVISANPAIVSVKTGEKALTVVALDEETADWLCESCGSQNFAKLASGIKRIKCFKCQVAKSTSCVLVASTKTIASSVSTSIVAGESSNNITTDKVKLKKAPPTAIMDLKSDFKYASLAEKQRVDVEKNASRKRKNTYFEALKRANKPTPILLNTKMKKLLEQLLQIDDCAINSDRDQKEESCTIDEILKLVETDGLISPLESNVLTIELQLDVVSNIVRSLKSQGFSESAIAKALKSCLSSTETILDECDSATSNDKVRSIFHDTIVQLCLEYMCLYFDEDCLPEVIESKKIVVNARVSLPHNPNFEFFTKYGWSHDDVKELVGIQKESPSEMDIIVSLLKLWHVSRGNISELPGELVKFIQNSKINESIVSNAEDCINQEIDILNSIYPDRFSYTKVVDDTCCVSLLCLDLDLSRGGNVDEYTLEMIIHPLMDYPNNTPLILLKSRKMPRLKVPLLPIQLVIWKKSLEFIGNGMLFQVASYLESEYSKIVASIACDGVALNHSNEATSGSSKKVITSDGTECDESTVSTDVETESNISMVDRSHSFWSRNNKLSKTPMPTSEMIAQRKTLPAWNSRDLFLEMIKNNRVLVLTGETGCGKTTQIPQFIFEENKLAKILICQPRRLAAIGVANRVAEELNEEIGNTVGYMVRGDSKASKFTKLVFCTYGVMLRRLQHDSNLDGVDYIILDEVHERGMDSDFSLALLMAAMRNRKDLKLIVMSATISTEKFAIYLEAKIGASSVPVLSIPGYTFPVEEFYKGDFEDIVRNKKVILNPEYDSDGYEVNGGMIAHKRKGEVLDYDLIVRLILMLSRGYDDEDLEGLEGKELVKRKAVLSPAEGTILVFMPGVVEINKLIRLLQDNWSLSIAASIVSPYILPLHGNLTPFEQKKVFEKTNRGYIKIVVATNVAEASITIPDVTVVIDSCRVKEIDFDIERQMTALIMKLAAHDSLRQRRGRAGRVQRGRCYRCITVGIYDRLAEHSVPEILRAPIESLILQVKSMNLKEDCIQLLADCPDPPSPGAIAAAMRQLVQIQALDTNESITPLGQHLSKLPCAPKFGKLLVFGSILGSVFHASAIVASLSIRSPFINNPTSDKSNPKIELSKNTNSDHVAMAYALLEFNKCVNRKAKISFCKQFELSYDRLVEIGQLQQDLLRDLVSMGLLSTVDSGLNLESIENRNCTNTTVIQAILCAGLYPSASKIMRPAKRFVETAGGNVEKDVNAKELKFYIRDKSNEKCDEALPVDNISTANLQQVFIHPSSINFHNTSFKLSNFIVYSDSNIAQNSVHGDKIYIKDITEVSPLPLLFFGGKITMQYAEGTVTIDDWIKFSASGKTVALIQALRHSIDQLLREKILNTNINISSSKYMQLFEQLFR